MFLSKYNYFLAIRILLRSLDFESFPLDVTKLLTKVAQILYALRALKKHFKPHYSVFLGITQSTQKFEELARKCRLHNVLTSYITSEGFYVFTGFISYFVICLVYM